MKKEKKASLRELDLLRIASFGVNVIKMDMSYGKPNYLKISKGRKHRNERIHTQPKNLQFITLLLNFKIPITVNANWGF